MMKQYTNFAAMGTLLVMLAVGTQALAYAPESDLMKIKGYSPETIAVTDQQRSRQEWRQPSTPAMTPTEKFFHNIYYGDWIGDIDDFGNSKIRE